MRIQDAQESFRDLRELIVDLQVNARRKKRESFEQPLDVWILALIGFRIQDQPRSDLWILSREFRAQLPQEVQFVFVVEQQLVTHRALPEPYTRRLPAAEPCRRKPVRVPGPSAACLRSGNSARANSPGCL